MKRARTVLVTGGAGYIGSHVLLALQDAGLRAVAIDNLSTGFQWAIPEGVAFAEGDVADEEFVTTVMAEHGVDSVIHLAGSISVVESLSDPLKYFHNNVAATAILLKSMVHAGVRTLLFSSSAAVYGRSDGEPVQEEHPKAPANPYGTSKAMAETLINQAVAAHGLRACSLRYFNVAGADPGGRSGQSTRGAANLIKVALEVAHGARDHVPVFGLDYSTPDGTGVRDYIHVSDLANAHIFVLQGLAAGAIDDAALNCGYGSGHSVLEVLSVVEAVTGRRVPRRDMPRREGDVGAMVADPARLRGLGWRPSRSDLSDIVGDAWRWEVR